MTIKKTFFLAVLAAVLSSALCIVYSMVYFKANEFDFSPVISYWHMIAASLVGTLVLAWGNFFALKFIKNKTVAQVSFNLLAGILSFASIVGAFAAVLPIDLFEDPTALFVFPGLAVPMHFFPILSHLAVLPLFTNKAL